MGGWWLVCIILASVYTANLTAIFATEDNKSNIPGRLEPNMLKNLPIIPSRTSQNFYLLFLFYSQVPTIIPFFILLCQ